MKRPRRIRVALQDAVVDERVQRNLETRRAQKIADEFDPAAMGTIVLSLREDDKYYVVDGQHRRAAAMLAGHGNTQFDAAVYEGLSLNEEARLFRLLNTTKVPSAIKRFDIRLVEGEPVAVHIDKIIHPWGWRVGNPGNANAISAVTTLEVVNGYDPDGEREVLNRTLGAITGAWNHDNDGVSAPVLGGVGVLINRFSEQIDFKALAKTMARTWGSPVNLASQGKNWKINRGGRVAYCVAEILHSAYNKRRPVHPLDSWS
jgi:hypothetical protein